MAYYFSDNSSDDEFDVNLGIREKLHINRAEGAMKPDYLYDDVNEYSNLPSSLVGQPGPSGLREIHSKKRQNRDRNLDRSENAKRTCLSNGNPKYPEKPKFDDVLNDLNPKQFAENGKVEERPNIFKGNILGDSSDSDDEISPVSIRGRNILRNYSSESDEFNFPANLTRKVSMKSRIVSDDSSSASQTMEAGPSKPRKVVHCNIESDDSSSASQTVEAGPSQPRKVLHRKIERIILSDESESDGPRPYLSSLSSAKYRRPHPSPNCGRDRMPRHNKVWQGRYVSPAGNGYKERKNRPIISNSYIERERNSPLGNKASNNDTSERPSNQDMQSDSEGVFSLYNYKDSNRHIGSRQPMDRPGNPNMQMDSEGVFSLYNYKDSNRHVDKKKDGRLRDYKPSNRDLGRDRENRQHLLRGRNGNMDGIYKDSRRDAVNDARGSSGSNPNNATAPSGQFAFEARFLPDMILPALSLQPSASHAENSPLILDPSNIRSCDTIHPDRLNVSMFSITISPLATTQSSHVGNVASRANLGSSRPINSSPISRRRSSSSEPVLVLSSDEDEITFLGAGKNVSRRSSSARVRRTGGARMGQTASAGVRQGARARRSALTRVSRSCNRRRRCSQHGSSLRRCDARCRKNKPGSIQNDTINLSGCSSSSSSSSSSSVSSSCSYSNASSSSGIEFFTADSDTETNGLRERRRSRLGAHRLERLSRAVVRELSLSPDPVALVQQVQTDEEFARHLQAQFDAEVAPEPSTSRRRPIRPVSPAAVGIRNVITPRFFTPINAERPNVVNEAGGRRRAVSNPRLRYRLSPQFLSDDDDDSFIDLEDIQEITAIRNEMGRHFLDGIRGMQNQNRRNTHESLEALLDEVISRQDDVPRGLRLAEISRLPIREYVFPGISGAGAHRRADLNKECQVCLSDYEAGDVLRILPCFHEFHIPCIDPWLKINRTCPVCRVTIDVSA